VRRDDVPPRTVHGDLYDAQVFVGREYSLGLIDLDDVGPGDPAMDAGNFLAHLVALALAFPSAGRRVLAYRTLMRTAFLDRLGLDPAELAWREALEMFQLALGPLRTLNRRWPHEVNRRVGLALRLGEAA
jgi:aminoglycoside phosphotransferase (APT) family kinase protein